MMDLFLKMKSRRLPVAIKEYLTPLEAMDKKVIERSIDQFYYLARTALVKDEANYDKFDRAFAEFWQGVETIPGIEAEIPLEWLLKQVELTLSEEEKKQIAALGGWEKLMETLKKRLEEQKGRHQGGSKWIGTGGTSPFGAYGYNPEGIRIGQEKGRNRSAVKVWDDREYRNLDDSVELGTRNITVPLRTSGPASDETRGGYATISPYEILHPGVAVDYSNQEPGAVWINRVTEVYAKCVWLNPEPEEIWNSRQSIGIMKELMNGGM